MLGRTKAVRKVMVAFFTIMMMSSVTGTVAAADATSDLERYNSTRSNSGVVVDDGGHGKAHILVRKIPTGVGGEDNGTDVLAHILIRKIPTGVDGGDDDEDPRERGGIYTTQEECEAAGGKWVVKKGFDHGFCFIRLGVSSDTL